MKNPTGVWNAEKLPGAAEVLGACKLGLKR